MTRRFLIASFGSLGDLFPLLAVGVELRRQGQYVRLAGPAGYEERVRAQGLDFMPISPQMSAPGEMAPLMERIMDPRHGPMTVVRELMMPAVRTQFEELLPAARQSDLLVSHPITYGAPAAAEAAGIPWAAAALQPMVFFSKYDPPVLPNLPGAARLYGLGPAFTGLLFALADRITRPAAAPLLRLRRELKLADRGNPIMRGQFSPHLNLALFSRLMAQPQRDWPPNSLVTGFPFWDSEGEAPLPSALEEFLSAGSPPIVFTLGSSAVQIGGDFYMESLGAARQLGRRSLLLVGEGEQNRLPHPLPEDAFAAAWAPHAQVFPRAAAIVHQGGVGTTGQALRSGRPSLFVTFSHDQPDNLARCRRLGVALGMPRRRYNSRTAAAQLHRLLTEPSFARSAEEAARQVQREPGAPAAAAALLQLAGA